MSEVLDAAFNLVHDHPGGAASLAPRVGKNQATLCHEVTGHGTAKLGIETAVKLSVLTGDVRILNAFAAQCGCLVPPMVRLDDQDAHELMSRLALTAKEFGEFVAEVAADTRDSRISANELKRIEREWSELVSAGQSLVAHVRAMHECQASGRAGGAL